ncbi:unnamed protein product [Caenorhabditis auriculariae]|uniref:Uncharacterized protein n=1 Tax=Caenorhabditis auriculariae TaxID=2777116 RepID=A0A8S1HFN0_9PELO|nr:unnamed protein product [Caenorhabditis auriculariae]
MAGTDSGSIDAEAAIPSTLTLTSLRNSARNMPSRDSDQKNIRGAQRLQCVVHSVQKVCDQKINRRKISTSQYCQNNKNEAANDGVLQALLLNRQKRVNNRREKPSSDAVGPIRGPPVADTISTPTKGTRVQGRPHLVPNFGVIDNRPLEKCQASDSKKPSRHQKQDSRKPDPTSGTSKKGIGHQTVEMGLVDNPKEVDKCQMRDDGRRLRGSGGRNVFISIRQKPHNQSTSSESTHH